MNIWFDRTRALLETVASASEVAAASREARALLKEFPMQTEAPKTDSEYVRGIKRAMEIAAHTVPSPDGERPRFADEIIHALGREIDFGAL